MKNEKFTYCSCLSQYAKTGFVAGLLYLAGLLATTSVYGQTNMALHKSIDASSSASLGTLAGQANDGDTATSWVASGGGFPQWIVVDLGRISTITQITNRFVDNTTWRYKIEGSNTNANLDFNLIVDRTGAGVAGKDITENVSAVCRYVRISITGSATGNWASSRELQVIGTPLSQPTGIVPAINPVNTGNYLVGAQMCNLWGAKAQWDPVRNPYIYNGRKPLMGWYDESYDVSTDWQIKMAREHGIGFFFTCWFRGYNNAGKSVMSQYDQFINAIANTASYRDSIKWAIQWVNDTDVSGTVVCDGTPDFINNIAPFWIANYFSKSNYLKIDNKPVVSIYDIGKFISECGGAVNATYAISQLRSLCVSAGYSGVILMTSSVVSTTAANAGVSVGVDYLYSYHVPTFTELYTVTNPTVSQVTGWQRNAWSNYTHYSGLPYITSASVGWDSAPWGGASLWQLSPSDYQTMLSHAKARTDSQAVGSVQKKMVLLDNWNEYAEGHMIAPTVFRGYGYLDAVRAVFSAAGPHTDTVPDASVIPQLEPVQAKNLAFHRPVITSTFATSGYEGAAAVDGSAEYTYWVANSASLPQWLQVDLGSAYGITQVKTIFFADDLWKYKIEGSADSTTWTVLSDHTVSGVAAKIADDYLTGVYRFIKITIAGVGNNWAAIREFEVFGNEAGPASAKVSNTVIDPKVRHGKEDVEITVYPNPAVNNIHFSIKNVKEENLTVEMFNINGIAVHVELLKAGNIAGAHQLRLNKSLPAGTYLLTFTARGIKKVVPIVIVSRE